MLLSNPSSNSLILFIAASLSCACRSIESLSASLKYVGGYVGFGEIWCIMSSIISVVGIAVG